MNTASDLVHSDRRVFVAKTITFHQLMSYWLFTARGVGRSPSLLSWKSLLGSGREGEKLESSDPSKGPECFGATTQI